MLARFYLLNWFAVGIVMAMLSLWSGSALAEHDEILAVIVNPEMTHGNLSKSELSLIFWRKKLYWSNGHRIQPVNLGVDHPSRVQFSKRILSSSPESQTDYWNGLYYHGVSPPRVMQSPEAVIRFVAESKGAIAYIDACRADARVKTLAWITLQGDVTDEPPEMYCNH